MVEDLLKEYPNVLILRVRMPIVADLTYPRNFITKIIKYDKVSQFCNFVSCACVAAKHSGVVQTKHSELMCRSSTFQTP